MTSTESIPSFTSMPHLTSAAVQPRVHVLGLGAIGLFAAHTLLEIPKKPAVTLLLHRKGLVDAYRNNGSQVIVKNPDGSELGYDGFDLEPNHPITDEIQHLILSVKAWQTAAALRPLQHRLTSRSTILFLQNGCGMIDDVNAGLFRDPSTRPNYIIGVISHGVTLLRSFHVWHTGISATSLGMVPRSAPALSSNTTPDPSSPQALLSTSTSPQALSPSTSPLSPYPPSPSQSPPLPTSPNYLLTHLPHTPRLNATPHPYPQILQLQLEKLTVNAFCNPLCALADAPNKHLFSVPRELRTALLMEISNVVMSLPELAGEPGLEERFSVARLEETVMGIIAKTAEGTCSIVWGLRKGRRTEVGFINGYWVRRGLISSS
ncbi:ApbA-domain-containing protein [Aspergillus ellipticus CBS 707.79]|uniref:ApbA-domain-containing protein n=1 Tax=Aspergillus ellipticus CBS 707.79 TaxID=1448320 RepID=A0A319DUR8_9EURO|nr:ApbA-domain-containing protein [Aspergillus ellipticus CBS 707.79]